MNDTLLRICHVSDWWTLVSYQLPCFTDLHCLCVFVNQASPKWWIRNWSAQRLSHAGSQCRRTTWLKTCQNVDAAGWPASESPSCTWVLTILRAHKQLVIPISCMSLRRNSTCLKLIGHFSLFHQLWRSTTAKKNGHLCRFSPCTGAHGEHKSVLKHYTFSNDFQERFAVRKF